MKKFICVMIFVILLADICIENTVSAAENVFDTIKERSACFEITSPGYLGGEVNYYSAEGNAEDAQVLFNITNATGKFIDYNNADYFMTENNGKDHRLRLESISGNDEDKYLSEPGKTAAVSIICYGPQAEKSIPMDKVDGFYIRLDNGDKITFFQRSSLEELASKMSTGIIEMSEFEKKNGKAAEHLQNINAIVLRLWAEHENSIELMRKIAPANENAGDIVFFITSVMTNGDCAMELGNLILQLFTLQYYSEYTRDTRGVLVYNLKYAKHHAKMYLMQADNFTAMTQNGFYKGYSNKYSVLISELEKACDAILSVLGQESVSD